MQQFEAEEIGARIRQARLEHDGLTQENLAAMASFSKRSLQYYEAGVTIPYKHLRELSRLLNKPEDWFLYGEQSVAAQGEERLRKIVREIVREEIEAALAPIRAQLEDDPLPRAASA
jgi:transcriptional regulator with XRE-family HTH domain